MKRKEGVLSLLTALVLAASCTDQPVVAPTDVDASFAKSAPVQVEAQCLTAPDFVVGDEESFRAALAAAVAGSAIAIDGTIELAAEVRIDVPGLTLGCLVPGSGLTAAPGAMPYFLLWVVAPTVTIRGLVLDGSGTVSAPVYAQYVDDQPYPPAGLSIVDNRVTCGAELCVFLVGTPQPVVKGNVLEAYGTGGGIHIQSQVVTLPDGSEVRIRPDGARIEGNTINQFGVSGPNPILAGIRINASDGAAVVDNTIQGAWPHGIHVTGVGSSRIADNHVAGAQGYGVRSSTNALNMLFVDNSIVDNRIMDAGAGGVLLEAACGNTVATNVVNVDGDEVVLAATAGANVVTHRRGSVVDHGYADCDGDRLADFNVVNRRTTLEANLVPIPPKAARQCLEAPDFVVQDEGSFFAALESARPWDEIAVDGMIALGRHAMVSTPALTIGCATPGSGLTMAPWFEGETWGFMTIGAPDVTLRGLRIDGGPTTEVPVFAGEDGTTPLENVRLRFVGNDVIYGAQGGLFTAGAREVTVSDNRFHGERAQYAAHVQTQGGGSRVERNDMSVQVGGFLLSPTAAAIRLRDGGGGVVADNVIRGPFVRGINVAELWDSDIVGNTVDGVLTYGIRASINPYQPISVHHNRIRNNRISGSGVAAMFFELACSNVLLGNQLDGNAAGTGVVFDVTTGLNVLTGNTVTALDNGAFDCTGDGVFDPNVITGKGKVGKGVPPGEVIGPVMSSGKRVLR